MLKKLKLKKMGTNHERKTNDGWKLKSLKALDAFGIDQQGTLEADDLEEPFGWDRKDCNQKVDSFRPRKQNCPGLGHNCCHEGCSWGRL